jgi:hypothetical protein
MTQAAALCLPSPIELAVRMKALGGEGVDR